jgi:hypothetical protein
MQIPIVSGIYAGADGAWRTAYPVNMEPTPKSTGISEGNLRVADGIVSTGVSTGVSRGGILWDGTMYRVQGSKLVSIRADGVTVEIGDVGTGSDVSMTYGFSHLAVASGGNLFLYDGTTLAQVTDADLGTVIDVVWIDGYFLTTDGEFLVVTELNDPFSVSPLKYGSSEVDPDPVLSVLRVRNELAAINRYTIETFNNIGGENFPFQRVNGAQVHKGAVGTHCACVLSDAVAVLGSGRNEVPSVWLCANGGAQKLATAEIDEILATYSEQSLSGAYLEVKTHRGHDTLLIHLPDRCLAYDASASVAMSSPVWYTLTSSAISFERYRAKHHVWAYNAWHVGDTATAKTGKLDRTVATHFGDRVRWEFVTPIVYNESKGILFHELELIGLFGVAAVGATPLVSTSYTLDGVDWSQPKTINIAPRGARNYRARWLQQGHMTSFRGQRFQGDSASPIAVSRLEARVEPLLW